MPPAAYAQAVERLSSLCQKAPRPASAIRQSLTFRAVITLSRAEAARARARVVDNTHGHRQDLPEYLSFGGAQECLDKLAPYAELGVQDFLLGLRPPLDRHTLERFADEVAPALRRMIAP